MIINEKKTFILTDWFCLRIVNTFAFLNLDTTRLIRTPIYKILGTGGDFTNLFFNPESPRIVACGTYSIESTSVYVEHVKQHNNPIYNNKDNKLSYYFWKNNYCVLTYKTPDTGQKAVEVYKRVPGGIPR
jgi:hypothetical protein